MNSLARTEVEPITKEDQLFDARREAKENPHGRLCKCRSCIGRRNRRKGKAKQRPGRKALEHIYGVQAKWSGRNANEETWDHLPLKVEAKSGKQVAPAARIIRLAENQIEATRAIGDIRPAAVLLMPDGMSDGYFVCRISQLGQIIDAAGGV